jgi:hypothetical protein
MSDLAFPTPIHSQAAEAVVTFFSAQERTQAVVLVNSCARGAAVPESDLDVAILVASPVADLTNQQLEWDWREHYASCPVFRQLEALSPFARVHLDLFDGRWAPERWDDGGGPDSFEIEIGNRVAHAVLLWGRSKEYAELQAAWLPYYPEPLRRERLDMVKESCRSNIDRLRFYSERGEYFQAFDRLYHAFQECLQAVFIAHRVYPIAYNKWLREQVEDWLGHRALYAALPVVLAVKELASTELIDKGEHVLRLMEEWASADRQPPNQPLQVTGRAPGLSGE